MRTRTLRSGLAIVAVVVLAGGWAAADIIGPGVNCMKTQPGSTWGFLGADKLPSDFFGPGSDPFEGQIAIFTDTNVWHGESTEFVNDKAGVPVEIVAMTLHSLEPVEVMFTDPDTGARVPKLYDVVVTLDPSAASTGMYKVARDPGGGSPDRGTILANGPGDPEPIPPESFFDVFFKFEFTPRDPSIGEPAELLCSDHVTLTADVPWGSMASPLYYSPLAGDFYPGLGDPLGDPNVPATLIYQGQAFAWHLRLEPIPEPATLSLLALGALALLRRRRAWSP